jgi:hypothetical protein
VDREHISREVEAILDLPGPAEVQTHLETLLEDLHLDAREAEAPFATGREASSPEGNKPDT